jgi:hypothetical protein
MKGDIEGETFQGLQYTLTSARKVKTNFGPRMEVATN